MPEQPKLPDGRTEVDEKDQSTTYVVSDSAPSPLSRTKRVAAGLVKSLRADWPNIESCVQAAGRPVTRPDAVVTLRFSLHADGEFADDQKIEATGWPAAALCIRDTLRRLPLPELGGDVDVVYRMDLEDEAVQ